MKKLLLLCSVALILSGCAVKGDFKLGINSDKTVDFGVTIAYDDELIEVLMTNSEEASEEVEYTEEQKWEFIDSMFDDEEDNSYESAGFTSERYQEGDFKGYTYSKNLGDIESVTAENASFNLTDDSQDLASAKFFTKNGDNYVSKITFVPVEETDTYQIDSSFTFTVTLPTKPISHNADNVSEDGKTLTWNLVADSQKNIDFEFNFSSFPLIPVIIGVAVLLVIIIIIIVVVTKGKKGPKNFETQTNELKTETVSTSTNLEQTNQVTPPVENNQMTNEINEVKPINLEQEVNVQPLEQPVEPTQVQPVNMNNTPNETQNSVNPQVQSVENSPASTSEDLLNSIPKRDN